MGIRVCNPRQFLEDFSLRNKVDDLEMTNRVSLQVNGSTSNLGAGFDALGLAVELPLRVTCYVDGSQAGVISARGEGADEIANSEDNIIAQAFERACVKINRPAPRLAFEIDNHIPLKRGLGSSGAAIIAGVLAAHAYFDGALSQQQLLDLACELEGHPENASASLLGGLTVNGVEEGSVICARFAPPANWVAACFVPDLEIATEDARRVLPSSLTRHEAVSNLQSTAMMVSAFAQKNPELLRFATRDTIHQPYRKKLIPAYDEITAAAIRAGAFCAFISGSGSTMLAICDVARSTQIATAMQTAAHAGKLAGRPMILPFASRAAEVSIS